MAVAVAAAVVVAVAGGVVGELCRARYSLGLFHEWALPSCLVGLDFRHLPLAACARE